ncbi:carboxymuconolactone decarboxylase family protein [Listeria weihenstephanensis]|uniref:Carboxymuconolactone decarboxylase family protein n=1 Tax=Listeria weihenstephanensis TaxID=1006155 RepID=A0A841Z9J2_9LIST|nr:carboxymuconolactone decarboxylase family protein [Listeria weihenstephanensis]MBC1501262.1 carboxymuconolactone decarboxylase family protein [Listeria weihenstephanensis]
MSISRTIQADRNQIVTTLKETDSEFISLSDNFTLDKVLQCTKGTGKQRMKEILAALVAMQCVEKYKIMLNWALNNGVTPTEAKEIVYQAAPTVGLGKVFEFSQVTNDILIERNIS